MKEEKRGISKKLSRGVKLKSIKRNDVIFHSQRINEFLLENIGKKAKNILSYPSIMILLMLANIIGSLLGYEIYLRQLKRIPLHLWIFLPDCPLMSTLFLFFLLDRSRAWINAWIVVGSVKGFIFTFLWIFLLPEYAVDSEITLVAHGFLVFQAMFFVLPVLVKQLSKRNFMLASIVTFVPDFSDIFLNTMANLPLSQSIVPLTIIGYILSDLIFLSLLWLLLTSNSLSIERESVNRKIAVG